MEYVFFCDREFAVYKNASASAKAVNISVQEHCGGNSRVTIFDSHHNVVSETRFLSPGGVVTLTVSPDQEVEVFCDGGTDPHGCKVDVSF